jgi:ADP-ribose pyrophosphatase YjhB (NUDIX family)
VKYKVNFPVCFPTVDLFIIAGKSILLGRKSTDPVGLWRFSGGFVDPGESLEQAALREAYEETGVVGKNPVYLFSMAIDDSRYSDSVHSVTTSMFGIEFDEEPKIKAGDDLEEVRWFYFPDLTEGFFINTHKPLITKLLKGIEDA